jgi:hypothetical protein
LTDRGAAGNLNFMSHLIFASRRSPLATSTRAVAAATMLLASAAVPRFAAAQWVPGRELLDFPIGTLAEAPALATRARVGLWNPANIASRDAARTSFGIAALATPNDQGVSALLFGGARRMRRDLTVGLSVARASVRDLLQTDVDPSSQGELRYETNLVSAMVARRSGEHLATGLAVRYRAGQLAGTHRGAVAIDGGVLLDGLGKYDGRVAASTFLWSPANQENERVTYSGAADLRMTGDSAAEVRGGYSFSTTERGVREHFLFASGRRGIWEGRGGVARGETFGDAQWRLRLGVGVYYARYAVAVAREENGAGLGAIYQFSLSSTLR